MSHHLRKYLDLISAPQVAELVLSNITRRLIHLNPQSLWFLSPSLPFSCMYFRWSYVTSCLPLQITITWTVIMTGDLIYCTCKSVQPTFLLLPHYLMFSLLFVVVSLFNFTCKQSFACLLHIYSFDFAESSCLISSIVALFVLLWLTLNQLNTDQIIRVGV